MTTKPYAFGPTPRSKPAPVVLPEQPGGDLDLSTNLGNAKIIFDRDELARVVKIVRSVVRNNGYARFEQDEKARVLVIAKGRFRTIVRLFLGGPVLEYELTSTDPVVPGAFCLFLADFLNMAGESKDIKTATLHREAGKILVSFSGSSGPLGSFGVSDLGGKELADILGAWRVAKVDSFEAGHYTRLCQVPTNFLDVLMLSVCDENSRYAIAGVHVAQQPGRVVKIESTDGRRASALSVASAHQKKGKPERVIVPRQTVRTAVQYLSGSTAIDLVGQKGVPVVRLSNGSLRLFAPPVEGAFPPIADVMPHDNAFNAAAALDVAMEKPLRDAHKKTSEDRKGLAFKFDTRTPDTLKLNGWADNATPADPHATGTTPFDIPEQALPSPFTAFTASVKDDFTIGFSALFIADALKQVALLGAPSIGVRFIASNKPAVFNLDQPEGLWKFAAIVMPVNLAIN